MYHHPCCDHYSGSTGCDTQKAQENETEAEVSKLSSTSWDLNMCTLKIIQVDRGCSFTSKLDKKPPIATLVRIYTLDLF